MLDKKRLVLIDGDFLGFFATYPTKKYISNINFKLIPKTLDEVLTSCDKWINEIFKNTKADYYVGCLTVGKNFRYKIFPEYKASRKNLKKPDYFNELRDHLIFNHKFVFDINYEADDLVNMCKNKFKDEYICTIASNDQDLNLLEGKHYNTTKKVWITTDKNTAHFEFWKDMITGQNGDGIKGIPGKGKAYADNSLEQCSLLGLNVPSTVLHEYILNFGEDKGIEEFYKVYKCLKIVDDPELIHFKPIKINNYAENK